MNNQLQCPVVLDLLPLYREGLLRPETSERVARHLRECAGCRRATGPESAPNTFT